MAYALRATAPVLFAAARERDKLREALEAAATFIEVEWERRATDAVSRLGPPGIPAAKAAHEVLAKVRAALGREGTP